MSKICFSFSSKFLLVGRGASNHLQNICQHIFSFFLKALKPPSIFIKLMQNYTVRRRKNTKTISKWLTSNISVTYWFGTNGVVFTFGCTTWPIANIPPPCTPSKQCANIFFTFPDDASCDIMDVFAWPKPSSPSNASLLEPKSPDCLAPHLSQR